MKQTILFVLLNEYADWEGAYLTPSLRKGVMDGSPIIYEVKTVAPTLNEVISAGGFRTKPDYSFDTIPNDYAALVLIGGYEWDSPEAKLVKPIVNKALEQNRIVAGICNGASFLASCGCLNNVKHTGNGLDQLKLWGGENYTNEAGFVERQAMSDRNIVTANGTGSLEFARELLLMLKADTEERIKCMYNFRKNGFYKE